MKQVSTPLSAKQLEEYQIEEYTVVDSFFGGPSPPIPRAKQWASLYELQTRAKQQNGSPTGK